MNMFSVVAIASIVLCCDPLEAQPATRPVGLRARVEPMAWQPARSVDVTTTPAAVSHVDGVLTNRREVHRGARQPRLAKYLVIGAIAGVALGTTVVALQVSRCSDDCGWLGLWPYVAGATGGGVVGAAAGFGVYTVVREVRK